MGETVVDRVAIGPSIIVGTVEVTAPEMSATEAQLGLRFEVELECALEYGIEFGRKFELPS